MVLLTKAAGWAARTRYGRKAVETRADLSVFREPPSAKLVLGLVLLGVSFTIGWPAIAAAGAAAVYLKRPLLFLVGGPALYLISHVVWAVSMVLIGRDNIFYMNALLRFSVRVFIERYGSPPQGANISSPAPTASSSTSSIDTEYPPHPVGPQKKIFQ